MHFVALVLSVALGQATVIEDPVMGDQLMGDHVFNLQWIDTPPGTAHVTEVEETKGDLMLSASQKNAKGDFARVTGHITKVTAKTFELDGTVTTSVSYVNGGKVCERTGHFTFRITSGRKYWRLKEMKNCEQGGNVVDYVDIFFARPQSK